MDQTNKDLRIVFKPEHHEIPGILADNFANIFGQLSAQNLKPRALSFLPSSTWPIKQKMPPHKGGFHPSNYTGMLPFNRVKLKRLFS